MALRRCRRSTVRSRTEGGIGGEGSALIIERNTLLSEERRKEAGFRGDPGAERPGGEGGGQGGARGRKGNN